jgi:hypothetical protein
LNHVSQYHKAQKMKFFERENSLKLIDIENKREKRNKNIGQDNLIGALQIANTSPLSPNFGGFTVNSIPDGLTTQNDSRLNLENTISS